MDQTDERILKFKKRCKRIFLWALIVVACLVVCTFFLYHYSDIAIFLPTNEENIDYDFRCDGQRIERRSGSEWEDFTVAGVELDYNQNDASYDDYLRWLTSIKEMNANAVRVHDVMPPDFYRALLDVNSRAPVLYLIQGVELEAGVFADMTDMLSGDMVALMKKEGRLAIDAVHGNRITLDYKADVSKLTMAYVVGDVWDADLVLYTNSLSAESAGSFNGRYASVWEVSNVVETLIAQVFDDLFSYESRKYSQQHIIGFGNSQPTDMLFHDVSWSLGLNENVASVNTAHISASSKVNTGVFAALRVDNAVMQCLSFDPAYISYTDEQGRRNAIRYYLDSLHNAHVIPIILGGTTMSAARGVSGIDEIFGFDRGGVYESGQAEGLAFVYEQAVKAGLCGGFAGYYLDNPQRTAWNMEKFTYHSGAWLDAQDTEQSLGIFALEPGEGAVCTVDGNVDEWSDTEFIVNDNGTLLQADGDEKYLYIRVHIPDYDANKDVIYIPMDVTPLSGANKNPSQSLVFDRDMDFLLSVNGTKRAKLTVQEYYEPVEPLYDRELDFEFWYISPPDVHSDTFVDTIQYVRPTLYPDGAEDIDAVVRTTGILRSGCADPVSREYDERADYCVSGEDIELRIPWALLNFKDPSTGEIMGDFYKNGNNSIIVDEIYLGLEVYKIPEKDEEETHEAEDAPDDEMESANVITSYPSAVVKIPCYDEASYRERPRAAFDALRELFGEVG